jgi:hypothetical protein
VAKRERRTRESRGGAYPRTGMAGRWPPAESCGGRWTSRWRLSSGGPPTMGSGGARETRREEAPGGVEFAPGGPLASESAERTGGGAGLRWPGPAAQVRHGRRRHLWQRAGHDLALNRHGAARLACGARTPRERAGSGTAIPGRAGQGRWPDGLRWARGLERLADRVGSGLRARPG